MKVNPFVLKPLCRLSLVAFVLALAACGGNDNNDANGETSVPGESTPGGNQPDGGAEGPSNPTESEPEPQESGAWTAGDLHVHTYQSNDAQIGLASVLADGLTKYGLDWLAVSNHLRLSARDAEGNTLPGGSIAMSRGMALYEVAYIKAQQAAGNYSDKTIFSSFEWDMPTHDHVNVGIGYLSPLSDESLAAVAEFEYRFTNRGAQYFDTSIVSRVPDSERAYTTHADSLKALAWLRDAHPDSYMLLNHPSRYSGKYTGAQIREMNDLAPAQFFLIEGMVGNQMEPNRGGYETAYTPANLPNRTYGGADYYLARMGGMWDSLLGEGRRIWMVADSDYHFRTAQGKYSSGYAPGEYAKTHVWRDGDDMAAVVAGLKSGRVFGVFGDLIDALDFRATAGDDSVPMGGELTVGKGDTVTVTIKFRSPELTNQETAFESGVSAGVVPVVDHVDLIAGNVSAPAKPGSNAYASETNGSTRVIARFTANEWQTDADGYKVITHTLRADQSQYLRLRGTNLGTDVPNETSAGEPLPDSKVETTDNQARFNEINQRNYSDLWFYSNPVFVTVRP